MRKTLHPTVYKLGVLNQPVINIILGNGKHSNSFFKVHFIDSKDFTSSLLIPLQSKRKKFCLGAMHFPLRLLSPQMRWELRTIRVEESLFNYIVTEKRNRVKLRGMLPFDTRGNDGLSINYNLTAYLPIWIALMFRLRMGCTSFWCKVTIINICEGSLGPYGFKSDATALAKRNRSTS